MMKTVRFANVVQSCGQPETHLLLTEPAKDRALQQAVKAGRVMTVYQQNVGTRADRGKVAFEPGANRQFLLFPKSLRRFAGAQVVGIKYDLIEEPPVPKSQRAVIRAPRKAKARPRRPPKTKTAPKSNIVAFPPDSEPEEDEALAEFKSEVRRAMNALEKGKQVAAFNILKRAVGGQR